MRMHVCLSLCASVREGEGERERQAENNCVLQVDGQLLSLLLSIQQPSAL